jgi:hypothetical protein
MFNTPILFIVFNRIETTQRVFEQIRKIRPKNLYISADGPRNYKIGEDKVCNSVRDYIIQNIDWPCKISKRFNEVNLGCKIAVSNAIDWFFQNEEMGIILEDDCLPHLSFFNYADILLKKYINTTQIMMISGYNPFGEYSIDSTYYFSKYPLIWGWATWRRAWSHYDISMIKYLNFKKEYKINSVFKYHVEKVFWLRNLDAAFKNEVDTWDYQWCFTCWQASGYSIIPSKNLISNIGFGELATHTFDLNNQNSNKEVFNLAQFIHPQKIIHNSKIDKLISKEYFNIHFYKILERLKLRIKQLFN